MKTGLETLPFSGDLPEAPDDLRALDEEMSHITMRGTLPHQTPDERSMSGDLPMQGNLEVPEAKESFKGTLDLGELPTETATPEEDLDKSFSGSLGIESRLDPESAAPVAHQSERRASRPVPETSYDKLSPETANLYKDFRILAANPNTNAVTPAEKLKTLHEAERQSRMQRRFVSVYRDPSELDPLPWSATEYPNVLTFNATLRGGYEDVSQVGEDALRMTEYKRANLTHVVIQTEDGHDIILHRTTGPDAVSAKDQEFTLLTTKMLDAEEAGNASAVPVESASLKDIILVPGEPISTDFGLSEEQKSQLPSGRVTRIIGLSLDTPLPESHPRVHKPEYALNLDSELLAALPGAEERIPSAQGSLQGAEALPSSVEGQPNLTVLVPETVAKDEPAAEASNTATDSGFSGTLPPVPPRQRQPQPQSRRPRPPRPPQPNVLSIPAEPTPHGLSARELNRLLDSNNPDNRSRALAEARRQNMNDGTRIMPESIEDFTPKDLNYMSEQQIYSITPQQAKQMSRQARKSLESWQGYYREKRDQIVNATPERFAWIKGNISRMYRGMTEGAKGAYQVRLVGDATPRELARINPSDITVPDARRLYDERRRILEEQGYHF